MVDPPVEAHGAVFSLKNLFTKIKPGYAYLQVMYYDAVKEKAVPLPKGTPLSIFYYTVAGALLIREDNAVKIADSNGKVSFKIRDYGPIEVNKFIGLGIKFAKKTYLHCSNKQLITEEDLKKTLDTDKKYTLTHTFFLLPDELTFAAMEWDIDTPMYDKPKHRFEVPKGKALAKNGGYVPVVLKPEWQYVSMRYKEAFTGTDKAVPQSLLIKGFVNNVLVTASNLYAKECILIPWIENKHRAAPPPGFTKRVPGKVALKFKTPRYFIDPGGKVIVVGDPAKTIWSKPLTERYKYFDLPEVWESTNWTVKVGNDSRVFAGLVNRATTAAAPMKIYLDSVTFTKANLESIPWSAVNRYTLFNIKLAIQTSDSGNKRPYWTKGKVGTNCILPDATDKLPRRLGALNGKFYDITHQRSTAGGVIGARAAVLENVSVHHGQYLTKPVVPVAGHLELHYLTECLDASNNETPILLIYWSCRFVKRKAGAADPEPLDPAKVDLAGAADAEANKFRGSGFSNSWLRWRRKQYTFRPKEDPNNKNLIVYPLFFFEGREDANAIGPDGWPPPQAHLEHKPYKCTTLIRPAGSGRANMGLYKANFQADTFQPTGGGITEGGVSYKWFTMAHELGHAMGLHDEYLESLKPDKSWSPVLPTYPQWYDGMPYSFDNSSMMVENKAPRLRHFWYFTRWLNDTPAVKALTGNTKFQVYGKVGKKAYDYFLSNQVDFYKSTYSQNNYAQGTHGHFDLMLFKMGKDETTDRILPNQTKFDGILVVRLLLSFGFTDYNDPAGVVLPDPWPSDPAVVAPNDPKVPAKLDFLRAFQGEFDSLLNKRFYLTHLLDGDFRKIYVYFVPHYFFETNNPSQHFGVSVIANSSGILRHEADFRANNFVSNNFRVDAQQNTRAIIRYLLGLKPYKSEKVNEGGVEKWKKVDVTTIKPDELIFLCNWVKGKRGNALRHKIYAVNKP